MLVNTSRSNVILLSEIASIIDWNSVSDSLFESLRTSAPSSSASDIPFIGANNLDRTFLLNSCLSLNCISFAKTATPAAIEISISFNSSIALLILDLVLPIFFPILSSVAFLSPMNL